MLILLCFLVQPLYIVVFGYIIDFNLWNKGILLVYIQMIWRSFL